MSRGFGLKISSILASFMTLAVILPSLAAAQDYYQYLGPELGRMPLALTYRVDYYPRADVYDQETDHSLIEHQANLTLPVVNNPTNEFVLTAGFGAIQTDSGAVLPDSGQDLPEDLYSPRFGAVFRHKTTSGLVWGGFAGISSPSDEPFNSYDELGINTTIFLRKPIASRPNDAWLFFINYSNNRTDLNHIPLPMISYWYQPSPNFFALIGVPLALHWKPSERVTVNFFYEPIRSIRTGISIRVVGPVSIFGQYAYRNQKYFLADRADASDRLYYYEQRLSGGIKAALGRRAQFRVTGGYAFDRYYFQGEDFDDRGKDRVDLKNGAFISVSITLMF